MRLFLAALTLVALVLPAWAGHVELPVVPLDQNLNPVLQTFTHIEGDSTFCKIDNDTLQWVLKDLDAVPGWFNLKWDVESTCQSMRIEFKEVVYGSGTVSYSWGDAVPFYVGGLAGREAFQVGCADSFKICAVGTDANPDPRVEIWYWYERN